ncbi:hypothetical protein [Limnohabitans sp. Hippo4]|uniref:hypothetical protein n=1 Tax=Limnohabitans sp. Hippo4 TaxID=1826167 RepID=UPI0011B1D901|nr:hypothetical protein [Limnohabitans sp. Hippo4]
MQFQAGMAPFLNDELRVYSPAVHRGQKKRKPLSRSSEYYWLVRTVINYLLTSCCEHDFVLGVATVTAQGTKLSVFTSQFELADKVDLSLASASYKFFAAKTYDPDMGDIWVAKVVQEHLHELNAN